MAQNSNVADIQNALKATISKMSIYVRDTELTKKQEQKYNVGQVIREKNFVEASCKIGGMETSHRFTIFSNHMADMQQFEGGAEWGLFVARRNSHFKVVDIYKYKGKTQILLLHLLDDSWEMFDGFNLNLQTGIFLEQRKMFEDHCTEPVEKCLDTSEWKNKCLSPVGMGEDGLLYGNKIYPDDEMISVQGMGFRGLYHNVIYIKSQRLLSQLEGKFETTDKDDGVLAYPFIDDSRRLMFFVLSAAGFNGEDVHVGEPDIRQEHKFRFNTVADCPCFLAQRAGIDLSKFDSITDKIDRSFAAESEDIEKMREMAQLDSCRNVLHPDDIQVVLLSPGGQPENVWVHCRKLNGDEMIGELLHEAGPNFDLHAGDEITFTLVNSGGRLVCVAPIE